MPATTPAGMNLEVCTYRCPMTHVSMAAQTVLRYMNQFQKKKNQRLSINITVGRMKKEKYEEKEEQNANSLYLNLFTS